MMSALWKHAFALGSMLAGSVAVFGLVWAMNAFGTPPPKEAKEDATSFEVEKQKPKPKRQQRQRQRKPQTPRRAATAAPAPNLTAGLAGLSFDLPTFNMDALGSAADELLAQTQEQQVMTADTVDEKPEPRRQVQPEFPERARRKGLQGFVKLSMLIDASGAVATVKVLDAEPRGVFEDYALAAVKQWEYAPATYHGSPVKIWVEQQLQFRLN